MYFILTLPDYASSAVGMESIASRMRRRLCRVALVGYALLATAFPVYVGLMASHLAAYVLLR